MKSFSVTVPSEIVPAADDASAASKDEPAAGASSASKGSGSGPGAKTPDDGWPGPWFTVLAACVYALAALYQWRYPTSGLVEDEMTTLAIRRVNGVVRDAACGGWEMSDGTWSSFAGSGTAWHLGAIARERCGAKKLSHLAAAEVIDGRRVVVIGDSSARHVYAAIVRAAHANASAWSEARDMDAVANGEKHRDWEFPTPGVRGGGIAAFKWAPYAQNITSYLAEIERGEEPAPDVLVMGAALWHALHVRSEEEYLAALRGLKTQLAKTTAAVAATPASFASDGDGDGDGGDDGSGGGDDAEETPGRTRGAPRAFWLASTTTDPTLFSDAAKREHMTPKRVKAFNAVAIESGLVPPRPIAGAGVPSAEEEDAPPPPPPPPAAPCQPIDLEQITTTCGWKCTKDGVHYKPEAYDAAASAVLNALRANPGWGVAR